MQKIILLVAFTLILGGCGTLDRWLANTTGYSKACVDGVQYLQFASGASVAYGRDGHVRLCDQ